MPEAPVGQVWVAWGGGRPNSGFLKLLRVSAQFASATTSTRCTEAPDQASSSSSSLSPTTQFMAEAWRTISTATQVGKPRMKKNRFERSGIEEPSKVVEGLLFDYVVSG